LQWRNAFLFLKNRRLKLGWIKETNFPRDFADSDNCFLMQQHLCLNTKRSSIHLVGDLPVMGLHGLVEVIGTDFSKGCNSRQPR